MKILVLSDANTSHTIKWVNGLVSQGVEVCLWSLSYPKEENYKLSKNLIIESPSSQIDKKDIFVKIKYLTALGHLRRAAMKFNPDIVHAHYASSYGLLGRLINFHPFIISVWGADVYTFPKKNWLFRQILVNNLKKADKILSTSYVMVKETHKYTDKEVDVTPFGVDLQTFSSNKLNGKGPITIGTVKTLEKKYGIRYLIEAFAIFTNKNPTVDSQLLIVGSGSLELELKTLASNLGILPKTVFSGHVPFHEVPKYHNLIDIAVIPSIYDSESFGVSAIEANACENPVIVSDVGGLPEVVEDGVTGIVVEKCNSDALAGAIEKLYFDSELRVNMGKNGRLRVKEYYDWNDNLLQMVEIYEELLLRKKTIR